MAELTIQEAAATTGWSPRMLRYIESAGLVVPDRSVSGYRLYGPAHLQRLRTLRALLERHGVSLAEMGFAARLRAERDLSAAVDGWLAAPAERPADVRADDWLRFEQEKHQRLMAAPARPAGPQPADPRPSHQRPEALPDPALDPALDHRTDSKEIA